MGELHHQTEMAMSVKLTTILEKAEAGQTADESCRAATCRMAQN